MAKLNANLSQPIINNFHQKILSTTTQSVDHADNKLDQDKVYAEKISYLEKIINDQKKEIANLKNDLMILSSAKNEEIENLKNEVLNLSQINKSNDARDGKHKKSFNSQIMLKTVLSRDSSEGTHRTYHEELLYSIILNNVNSNGECILTRSFLKENGFSTIRKLTEAKKGLVEKKMVDCSNIVQGNKIVTMYKITKK